jgi:hypothetical protein
MLQDMDTDFNRKITILDRMAKLPESTSAIEIQQLKDLAFKFNELRDQLSQLKADLGKYLKKFPNPI